MNQEEMVVALAACIWAKDKKNENKNPDREGSEFIKYLKKCLLAAKAGNTHLRI